MPALELISGYVTAPDTTITGLTMCSNNSKTVRNAPLDSMVRLLSAWATSQTAGILQIRSPRLHDNVDGIQFNTVADNNKILFPLGANQKLVSQDVLSIGLSGSATAGDIEMASLLIYYDDLPGVEGRFINAEELKSRTKQIMSVTNTLALSTTGDYTGSEAINAEEDNFKANTDYALIGYQVSAQCGCVRWSGSDIGNLGVGGPGNAADNDATSTWFKKLSEEFGLSLIPVFNSANKGAILIDGQQDEDGADVTVNSIFAELAM
jgi:hypothetical protein